MSLVKIVHRLAFLLEFYLIIHHYCTYVNAFILVHLSVFEFASIGLALVRFILREGAREPGNCVLTCVNKVDLKDMTIPLSFIRINTWN